MIIHYMWGYNSWTTPFEHQTNIFTVKHRIEPTNVEDQSAKQYLPSKMDLTHQYKDQTIKHGDVNMQDIFYSYLANTTKNTFSVYQFGC